MAHIAGLALLWVSGGVAVSTVVEVVDNGPDVWGLVLSTVVMAALGLALWAPTEPARTDTATVFAAVAWTWVLVSVVGTLPYVFAHTFAHWDDALFESISGFSCTGSTIFGVDNPTIESQGAGLLFYRAMTQWYGGMGMVVLAVAVLPFLGVGGLSLMSAEAPGPGSDRLAPRVSETARRLWMLYAAVTALIALALWAAPGPTLYESVTYAFTTASTGGFGVHDANAGHYDSALVEAILVAGMFVGGASFTLLWQAIRGRPKVYLRSGEFRSYVLVLSVASAAVIAMLWRVNGFGFTTSVRAAVFNVVSVGTTTGLGNATAAGSPGDYLDWLAASHVVLIFLMTFGAMTGSTSGAAKIYRLHIGVMHVRRSMRLARNPQAVVPLKIGDAVVPDIVEARVIGFMFLYSGVALGGWFLLAMLGSDAATALGGSFTSLGGVGPALGEVGPVNSFVEGFTRPARGVLMVLMLVGRLEVFPVLLMFVAPLRALRR